MYRLIACLLLPLFVSTLYAENKFRLGIIGTDTSHVRAFKDALIAPNAPALLKQFQITAAFPGGTPDLPASWDRVNMFAEYLEEHGVTLYSTIEEMLPHVDGILLTSVDGRPHLEQARPVIAAGLPLYIDKPMAGSLADVITIFRLAEENNVPIFSSSALRFEAETLRMRNENPLGNILGATTWGPSGSNPAAKQPDLFWYGIHGIESLFTLMGTGVQTVSRTQTQSAEVVVGVWDGGRIGTFRGLITGNRPFGGFVFAERGTGPAGSWGGYGLLIETFCNFFMTGEAPIDPQETIELFAFMEGADISRDLGGVPVSIAELIEKASNEVSISVNMQVTADGTVQLNGRSIAVDRIAETLDDLAAQTPNSRVKVILRAERGAPHDIVVAVCNNMGKAMLANYLYER